MSSVNFVAINLTTLSHSPSVAFDLYLQAADQPQPKLYRSAGYPMRPEDLERLRSRGVQKLLITKSALPEYQAHLRQLIEGEASGGVGSFSFQMEATCEVMRTSLAAAFRRGDDDATVQTATELAESAAQLVTHDKFHVEAMSRLLYHDFSTFTHSVNVALYAAALATELAYDYEQISELAAACLLHDLGKLGIDGRILSKPGKLDESEIRQIRTHPTVGFRRLAQRRDLTFGQLMVVYQHHERLDGNGYPVGCQGNEIHPWARLCSIVDVFEALTSQRPYRSPLPRKAALEILQREDGLAFDPEMLRCWIGIIQRW